MDEREETRLNLYIYSVHDSLRRYFLFVPFGKKDSTEGEDLSLAVGAGGGGGGVDFCPLILFCKCAKNCWRQSEGGVRPKVMALRAALESGVIWKPGVMRCAGDRDEDCTMPYSSYFSLPFTISLLKRM